MTTEEIQSGWLALFKCATGFASERLVSHSWLAEQRCLVRQMCRPKPSRLCFSISSVACSNLSLSCLWFALGPASSNCFYFTDRVSFTHPSRAFRFPDIKSDDYSIGRPNRPMIKLRDSVEKTPSQDGPTTGTELFVGLAGVIVTLVSGFVIVVGLCLSTMAAPGLTGLERWRAMLGGLFDHANRFGAIVTFCIFTSGLCLIAMGMLGRRRVCGWWAFLLWLGITLPPLVAVFLFLVLFP